MKERRLRKVFCLFACLMLLLALLPGGASAADVVASGECGADGDNLTWTLDSDGVLTISGTGAMADYGYDSNVKYIDQPWSDYQEEILSIIIEEGVTGIGSSAFAGCYSVKSMKIPKSVSSIDPLALSGLWFIKSLEIDPENPNYKSESNVVFDKTGETIVCECGGRGDYTIPDGVKTIGAYAFFFTFLENVTITDGVTTIGDYAFYSSYSLVSVTIPRSVTYISPTAFVWCQNIQIEIDPENPSYRSEDNVIFDKSGETLICCAGSWPDGYVIPDGVTEIGESAFLMSSVTSVTIPDSIEKIGQLAFLYCDAISDVYYGGSESDWAAVEIGVGNDSLLNATIHYADGAGASAAPAVEEHTPPTATQYVPYQEAIPASLSGGSFALTSGSLPAGLSLSSDGVISGFPGELGVFSFTVTETSADGGSVEHKCSLSTYSRMYADVEGANPPGYGFVETAGDDGRVQDQTVASAEELTDQVMHCEGPFPQFRNLYLDGRRLVRDVEYRAEEGSTKITIYAETIGEEGGGTHTLAAEFETDEGETVYTVQNYTVYGIASTDVHVEVTGEAVIWTDAEPYIDENSRTMTPFRVVGDALGLTIAWDSAAREASFSDGAKTIYFPIGSTAARTSEGSTVEMDTSAVILNGRTYAPVRYLAQYFGYSVGWDAPTRTVKIG